jgi:hypothetical protein
MDIKEKGCEDKDWIQLAQDKVQGRTLVNTMMNARVTFKRWGIYTLAERLSFFQEVFYSMNLLVHTFSNLFTGKVKIKLKRNGECRYSATHSSPQH